MATGMASLREKGVLNSLVISKSGEDENLHPRDEEEGEGADEDFSKPRSFLSRSMCAHSQLWYFLLVVVILVCSLFWFCSHGNTLVLHLSSGWQPPYDPWDMEPQWSILESWWLGYLLEYIGPPLFFITHTILDPLCFIAGLEILFLTLSGLFLYRCGQQWLPENTRWKATPLPEDIETIVDPSIYPKVVVQLPMHNEQQVYARGIAASCSLIWPTECLLIQVLDDSTIPEVSEGMKKSVDYWRSRGVNVTYKKRFERKGFKAGNLREGLEEEYIKGYAFVAIFDADFQPAPDWLLKTVHYLKEHKELALVQTRWTFLNSQECDLTRYQEVELKWHFLTEQLTGSYFHNFFGFNGTAGLWRLKAIMEAGNWRDDTTVEDMDMAFCTTMLGWQFLFLPHVTCPSELPATCEAYRKQQQRWSSGPVDLAKKRIGQIWAAKGMPLWHKLYVVVVFIGLRKALRSIVIFLSAGVVFPLVLLFPESLIDFPPYGLIFHVVVYNLCLFVFSPEVILLLPGYALFANAMALLRLRAIFAGLLDLSGVHEWVVTHKTGAARVANQIISFAPTQVQRIGRFLASITTGSEFGVKRSRSMPHGSPCNQLANFGASLQSPRSEGKKSRFYLQMSRSLSDHGKGSSKRIPWMFRKAANNMSVLPIPLEDEECQSVGNGCNSTQFPSVESPLLSSEMEDTSSWSKKEASMGNSGIFRGWNGRIYTGELVCSLVLFFSATISIAYKSEISLLRVLITSWTFLQAAAFFLMGIGYIGNKSES